MSASIPTAKVGSRIAALTLYLAVGACGDPAEPAIPSSAASVSILPASADIQVGGTIPLVATAKDAKGKTVAGEVFHWSSQAPNLLAVSQTGVVVALSPGVVKISADATSGLASATATVTARAPARAPGSILTLDFETHLVQIPITKLGTTDTARAGRDSRIGLAHTTNGSLDGSTVARASWPLLQTVAECPGGQVYASENSNGFTGDRIWSLNLNSMVATLFADDLNIGSDNVTTMTCDQANTLLLVGTFADVTDLYRYTPGSGLRFIRTYGLDHIMGMAQAANGTLYATVRDAFEPGNGQRLMTVNPTNGILTPVSTQRTLPNVSLLYFRGGRLLGESGSSLVEVNLQTGVATTLRTIAIP